MLSCQILAQAAQAAPTNNGSLGDVRSWMLFLAVMALAPFLLTMVTSFVKLVVVGSIIRSALGVQQIPPTQVITGLALVLSIHVMWPVGSQIWRNYQDLTPAPVAARASQPADGQASSSAPAWKDMASRVAQAVRPPLREFLKKNSHPANVRLFTGLRARLSASAAGGPTATTQPVDKTESIVSEITVLVPAFVVSELTEAFQIGFLIFVPFLVVDLVVSTLLMAMGMHMLQPNTVSLPLKLLLFVLVDGWQLIIRGTILGYA